MSNGLLITFEGGEGAGKSTQIKKLSENLQSIGQDVVMTREPGGCPAAEDIRNLLFSKEHDGQWDVGSETLLMFAARAMHIKDVIAPAIKAGKIVLCDRYMDSTRVYQGFVKKMDMGFIHSLEERIIGKYMPDMTFLLDLPAETAMARIQKRGAENENDRGPLDFYNALRNGFLDIAKNESDRCVIIDGTQGIDDISEAIFKDTKDKFFK